MGRWQFDSDNGVLHLWLLFKSLFSSFIL